jgi:hypothetical protein
LNPLRLELAKVVGPWLIIGDELKPVPATKASVAL